MFAYTALVNQKVKEDTNNCGFDKCVSAPLTKIKIEELLF